MVHVSLADFFADAVDGLRLADGCQRGDGKDLSLSTLEQAGSVGSGQDAGFTPDGPDLVGLTIVRTDAVIQNQASDLLFGDAV